MNHLLELKLIHSQHLADRDFKLSELKALNRSLEIQLRELQGKAQGSYDDVAVLAEVMNGLHSQYLEEIRNLNLQLQSNED